jgi:hypothetical protein
MGCCGAMGLSAALRNRLPAFRLTKREQWQCTQLGDGATARVNLIGYDRRWLLSTIATTYRAALGPSCRYRAR